MNKTGNAQKEDKERLALSAILCTLIWIILFLLSFFVPLKRDKIQERFTTIAVTLTDNVQFEPPVKPQEAKPIEEAVPEVPQEIKPIVPVEPEPPSLVVKEKPSIPPKSTVTPPPVPSAQTKPPALPVPKPPEQVLAPDLSGIPIGTVHTTTKAAENIPSQPNKTPTPLNPPDVINPAVQTFEGVVAKADTSVGDSTAAVSSQPAKNIEKEASAATQSTVSNINKSITLNQNTSVDGVSASIIATMATQSGSSAAIFKTEDGQQELIEPKNPKIVLSAANEKLIESDATVSIRFTVMKDGTVPGLFIQILPSSLLPISVQSEIKEQISKWRFSQGETGSSATFVYTISVK